MNMADSILIQEDLVKPGTKVRPGETHSKKWIVIHETGNTSSTAGALNHSKFIKRLAEENQKYLSWHYTVDDTNIIRHIPDNEIAWHAGDGRKADGGNMSGIGIEICVNKDSNFQKAVKNATKLVASLMKKFNIGINQIKQHHFFNGKDCPFTIRKYNFWDSFLGMCSTEFQLLR
ncbi:MAG: N-acetylmuramoyl-L-alanine amidase [Oscillospiraceae bacterium]|jgi:N-acetylmuramoyl-L-alanine amidase|nr:N-acetylmuramoyl-L-alanine amidase [Oscillospiraceae bacterium]